ncbi:hypothetical protein [Actinomycetospora chlora]|uniref:hypothetical protein n=1 Tax=Actinomycetospora chlora TaxID=663608 RepID=UPI0031E5E066
MCTSVAYGLTRIPRNSPVTMVCWVDVAGRGGRWYNVKVGPYDVFVKAERISNPVRTPFCPQVPTVQASLWGTAAEQQVGRTATFPSDATVRRAQTLPLSVDNWGPRRDWSGDCIAFAWLAIDSVGHKNGIRGGLRTATAQGLAGPLHPGLMPPRGALVFWRGGTGDLGHVAISLGSGWVATTNGYDTSPSPQANSVKKLNDVRLPYLGWRAFTELPR